MSDSMFKSIDASASALTAQRFRMDIIAGNLANIDSTRTPEGGPFKRQLVVFASKGEETFREFPFLPEKIKSKISNPGDGVKVLEVMKDPSAPRLRYEPAHPDANNEGYVAYPNIDSVKEMVDLINASRAYEANITAINSAKSMFKSALTIGK